MNFLDKLEGYIGAFVDIVWGPPLLILLLGGGLFFLIFSRFVPFKFFRHAVDVLRGKYDDHDDPGDINHYQALAGALAATVGVGNISGVAVAITVGGPGAIFWMWMSAFVGMATKFFTCTLAIMYRGKDSQGNLQGGPMYVIREGMGKAWMPLASFFALAGTIGCFPVFQANQLTQIVRDILLIPNGWASAENHFTSDMISGFIILFMVSFVILGGVKRIGQVAGSMVPFMVLLYVGSCLVILMIYADQVLPTFSLIIREAFSGVAVQGGTLGALIVTGVKRGAYSNEAGIGTAPMMHGAAKTKEPVREGLVAMLGPFIDTLVVCTMTALVVIATGVYKNIGDNIEGVTVTALAFEEGLPGWGSYILLLCIFTFAVTTLFSYAYYGTKCLGFLIGAEKQNIYNIFYLASIIYGSVASVSAALGMIDGMYALMAIPTMTSALYLAPRVMAAANDYFSKLKS